MLAELRAVGLRFTADGDRLVVELRSALTDELRATIRAHKETLLRELADEVRERRQRISAARDITPMGDFREALMLGRLHVCCNCSAFTFGPIPAGVGHCQYFNVEAWPFVPFWCSRFALSKGLPFPNSPPAREPATEAAGVASLNHLHMGVSA